MKKNKGITLIVLIVTIIILLIFLGVAIVMLRNGLIERAKQSKDKTLEAQRSENLVIQKYENIIDKFVLNDENKEQILAEQVEVIPSDSKWKVKNLKEALDYLYNT